MATNRLPSHRVSEEVATAKTLDVQDSGKLFSVTADATITLPAVAAATAGMTVTILNGGAGATDGTVTVTISPDANDKIVGADLTAADNKDIINTDGAGGRDYVTLMAVNEAGADSAWMIVDYNGTWTREA